MKKFAFPLLTGALFAAPLIALNYLAARLFDWPFGPYALFNWMVRVLPGGLITFGIDAMIDTLRLLGFSVAEAAKTAERGMAVLLFFTALTLSGALLTLLVSGLQSRPGGSRRSTTPEAARPAEPAAPRRAEVQSLSRRQFLITLGAASAVITVIGSGVGAALARAEQRRREEEYLAEIGQTNVQLPNLNDPVVPAPGTRPEYTPLQDHYKVFLNTEPTVIDGQNYRLPITGLVDNPLSLSLDDIRSNYTSFDQFVTLSCISGRIATSLISTTQWTGVSLQDVLADAGPQPAAKYLYIESGDGFYETIPLDLIQSDPRIMLCYAWDGRDLPVDHGYPLRVWIPDRYGMKQPKWITRMELISEDRDGYWVERGWSKTAQVRTTSVIDTVAVEAVDESGPRPTIPIGGIAWAGDRQISQVEVRVDGGEWQPARLRTPLSETTWVVWRFDWPFTAGQHTFEVRCAEGDGTPQIEERNPTRPDGATGIHRVEAEV